MTAEVVTAPMTLREAERAVVEAFAGIGAHKRNWERLRERLDVRATTRARIELSLAVLGFVNACGVLAEAEDRVGPARAVARPLLGRLFTVVGPGQEQCAQAWRSYQEARRSGDPVVVEAARQVWHDAFVAWHVALHERWTLEDGEYAEDLSRRLDESTWVQAGDAFESSPNHRQAVVSESREREREESIRRADTGLRSPWVRAPRADRPRPGR